MPGLRIGLTGGIASGKSAADAAFSALGATVLDADIVARALVAPGQPALAGIVRRFGAGILQADGTLDRRLLREHIFADDDARRALETILHPRIRERLAEDAASSTGDYVIVSIPLLAESSGRQAYPWLDRILVVDADEATQRARLLARDGIDDALAGRMIAAQASRDARLAIADDILVNEGSLQALQARIGELDAFYRRLTRAVA